MDHSFHSECQHADVDQDDCFCSVCQREWSFTGRDTLGGPVSLEYSREFLHPFASNFVQTFAQVVEDDVVSDFSLAIALKIIGRGESMCDHILGAETGHLLVGKVRSVIEDDGVGESEVAYYVLPEEIDNISFGDFK